MDKKTKILIDYARCGDGSGTDPRECCKCLRACEPAIFLLHQTQNIKEPDPMDPQKWRITPLWLSLCSQCMKCVEACPVDAIRVE